MSSSCNIFALPAARLFTGESVPHGSDRPVTTSKEADKRGGWFAYTQVGVLHQVSICSALLQCCSQQLQHLLTLSGQLNCFLFLWLGSCLCLKLRIAVSVQQKCETVEFCNGLYESCSIAVVSSLYLTSVLHFWALLQRVR